jgi:hypothetical protein
VAPLSNFIKFILYFVWDYLTLGPFTLFLTQTLHLFLTNLLSIDTELRSILTALLAIPLADDLPTPNSRKTCALAIWVIQSQRLPAAVLVPAKDRIAFALRRGIDGELGKEGKKGSASDGLKVSNLNTP